MSSNLNKNIITELIAKKSQNNNDNVNPYIEKLLGECKTKSLEPNNKKPDNEVKIVTDSNNTVQKNNFNENFLSEDLKTNTREKKEIPVKKYDKNNDPRIDNTLFVGNISLHISEKELLRKLKLKQSDIESIRFRSLPIHPKFSTKKRVGAALECFSGNSTTKNAYIILKNKDIMKNIIEEFSGTLLSGNYLRLTPASKGNQFSTFDRKKTIFIGGLPKFCTEDQLRRFVNISLNEDCVNTVRIIKSAITGKPKGFGFVLFKDRKYVMLSIKKLNNTYFDDSKISVTRALSEDEVKNKLDSNIIDKKKSNNRTSKKSKKVKKSRKVKKTKKVKKFGTKSRNISSKK